MKGTTNSAGLKKKSTDSYEDHITLSLGTNLVGHQITQPAGSTIIMMIRVFTQYPTAALVLGVRVGGSNQYWLQSGGSPNGGDYRICATLTSTWNASRTMQAEIYVGGTSNITADVNVETVILPA